MIELADIQEQCYNLDEKLTESPSTSEEQIRKHLDQIESKLKFTIPDIPNGNSLFKCLLRAIYSFEQDFLFK